MSTFRLSNLLWIVFLASASYGLYLVKYRVEAVRKEVRTVASALDSEKESLEMLQAEWAYLSRPDRIAGLAKTHLHLAPASGAQIVEIATLAPRETTTEEEQQTTHSASSSYVQPPAPHMEPASYAR